MLISSFWYVIYNIPGRSLVFFGDLFFLKEFFFILIELSTYLCVAIRDAPLNFQGGRKFSEEKNSPLELKWKKKFPLKF